MEVFWQAIGRLLLTVVVDLLDRREAERYRARNAEGQCALCGCPADGGMGQIDYGSRATAGVRRLDVCTPCLARRRRHRILSWTIVLSVVAVLVWWSTTHR